MTDDPVKILLVDDRPENLLALEAILEPLGQILVRADSGPRALRCVLEDEFATILLDVQMPGMNGFEVAEIIKSRERSRTIPIMPEAALRAVPTAEKLTLDKMAERLIELSREEKKPRRERKTTV